MPDKLLAERVSRLEERLDRLENLLSRIGKLQAELCLDEAARLREEAEQSPNTKSQ